MCVIGTFIVPYRYHVCLRNHCRIVKLNFNLTFSIVYKCAWNDYLLGRKLQGGGGRRGWRLKNFTLVRSSLTHFSQITNIRITQTHTHDCIHPHTHAPTRSPFRSDSLNKFNYLPKLMGKLCFWTFHVLVCCSCEASTYYKCIKYIIITHFHEAIVHYKIIIIWRRRRRR